eukprot:4056185-Lingulodinium_polyedra.AAC.1
MECQPKSKFKPEIFGICPAASAFLSRVSRIASRAEELKRRPLAWVLVLYPTAMPADAVCPFACAVN